MQLEQHKSIVRTEENPKREIKLNGKEMNENMRE